MKKMKFMVAVLAAVIALSGCTKTIDESPDSSTSFTESTQPTSDMESSTESTAPDLTSSKVDEPIALTCLGEVIDENPIGEIEVCSVNQALKRFNEISSSIPEGTPEQIVKTLMERNVLCFAIMHGKCWEQDGEGYGTKYDKTTPRYIPIKTNYIKDINQIQKLFDGTYTEAESSHLLHPWDVVDYCDTFFYENGKLYYDLDQLRAFHGDSFTEPTRVTIVSATDTKITFGRVGTPNNFLFTAVKEGEKWVLETFVTDAPAYSPMYTELTPTKRAGNSEFMEFVETQVGAVGGMEYCNWYGFDFRTEWCAIFVTWAYARMEVDAPVFARCDSEGRLWFRQHGQWQDRNYKDIAPGDSIFFDWDHDDSADHVGLVVGRDDKYVYTVEGNRSDTCIANKYELDCPDILGYGLMNWN